MPNLTPLLAQLQAEAWAALREAQLAEQRWMQMAADAVSEEAPA